MLAWNPTVAQRPHSAQRYCTATRLLATTTTQPLQQPSLKPAAQARDPCPPVSTWGEVKSSNNLMKLTGSTEKECTEMPPSVHVISGAHRSLHWGEWMGQDPKTHRIKR